MKFFLFILLTLPLLAAADEDADFLAVRAAFRTGDALRIERLAKGLKDSVLEPYVTYYSLRVRLESADPAAIHAFLERPEDTPVIGQLRGEWLKQLGKDKRWDEFAAEYPRLVEEDAELKCYALQEQGRAQQQDALQAARQLWLASAGAPPASCVPLFDAALANGVISDADIWERVRLALEEGNVSLARQLAKRLSGEYALPLAALSSATANAQRYLDKVQLHSANAGEREVALYAMQRLARQLPQLAYAQWERLAENFSAQEQQYFNVRLGYEAARNLDARALEWYQAAPDAALTPQQLAWRVRAALRVPDWAEVSAGISAMSVQQQYESAWRYWGARALKELGRDEEAEKLLLSLSSEFNFYGQMAAGELGITTDPEVIKDSYKPAEQELAEMQAMPAVQRTLALYRMGQFTDAAREWAWAVRRFDDKQLLAAAEIARRNRMYDRAINTADRTVVMHDFDLRYLAPYRNELSRHIQQNHLEEAWVYGLMRQESRFVSQARSSAGAAGLMQVMPATARWVARRMGIKDYQHSMSQQTGTNLALGTHYMKVLLEWFDNDAVLATTAYNAGPVRARRWRGDAPLEGAIYVETIPYNETREYVKKVMSNTMYYARQFGQPELTLKQRLGIVAPKGAASQQPMPDEQ